MLHTSINMAKPPLCAMQILGNELLRRPDLLVVLQRIEEIEVVRSATQVTIRMCRFRIIFPSASPKVRNSPRPPGEEQRNLHACSYRRQWGSCRTCEAYGASFLRHRPPSRLLPLRMQTHGRFVWTSEHRRGTLTQSNEWHFTLFASSQVYYSIASKIVL